MYLIFTMWLNITSPTKALCMYSEYSTYQVLSISNTKPLADDSSSQAWAFISVTSIEKGRAGWPPHSILKNSPTGLLRNVSSEQALNQLWEICTPAFPHIFPFCHFIPRFLSIFHLFLSYSQLFFTVFFSVFTKSVSYTMLSKVIWTVCPHRYMNRN